MTSVRPPRHPADQRAARPSWLRFGFLLAVGEILMLVLVVLHPVVALGSGRNLATSVGHTQPGPLGSAPQPPTSTTVLGSGRPAGVPPTPLPTKTAPPTAVPTVPPAIPARIVKAPGVLPANIAPEPNFLQSCAGFQYDDSLTCVAATLQAIANGRSHEGLAPMVLPTNWAQLSPEQQMFVATNLERTARGLPALEAMATALDQAARQGAAQDTDPGPPRGFPYSEWASNWAGAVGNPLEAIYFWMYDDGAGSANIDCTPSNESGCWGHRENILVRLPCRECQMGTGWDEAGYRGDPSTTELLVETSGTPSVDFTWRQESPYLP